MHLQAYPNDNQNGMSLKLQARNRRKEASHMNMAIMDGMQDSKTYPPRIRHTQMPCISTSPLGPSILGFIREYSGSVVSLFLFCWSCLYLDGKHIFTQII